MDPASNTNTNDPCLAVFHCERCCGPLRSAGCVGPRCHYISCCAGEVDAARLRDAFAEGADGVLVLGCLGKACCAPLDEVSAFHHIHAGTRTLHQLGLEPARLRWHWLTPREAANVPTLIAQFRRRLLTLNARRRAREARQAPAEPTPVHTAGA